MEKIDLATYDTCPCCGEKTLFFGSCQNTICRFQDNWIMEEYKQYEVLSDFVEEPLELGDEVEEYSGNIVGETHKALGEDQTTMNISFQKIDLAKDTVNLANSTCGIVGRALENKENGGGEKQNTIRGAKCPNCDEETYIWTGCTSCGYSDIKIRNQSFKCNIMNRPLEGDDETRIKVDNFSVIQRSPYRKLVELSTTFNVCESQILGPNDHSILVFKIGNDIYRISLTYDISGEQIFITKSEKKLRSKSRKIWRKSRIEGTDNLESTLKKIIFNRYYNKHL